MKSGDNSFNYFSQNKLTNLANIVQFKRMLMFCHAGGLEGWASYPPLSMPLDGDDFTVICVTASSLIGRHSREKRQAI